ncbi:MAG TPA: PEP-CTERM sorting domain-containing protein [Thiobacillaceae bacterium]|nr:PEP-CTERM sorting domain-containing protein [Thiobacillaceae bacterium]HNU64843.1 PEP-CTERM sorting domain-containing protein [Thiobacillaceae bacterium]
MNTIRSIGALLLALAASSAGATTLWLKDDQGNVCKNSQSSNPGQVIGLGNVTPTGAFSLTLSNPGNGVRTPSTGQCANLPTTPATAPLVFSGGVTPRIVPIHMWKTGTGGRMECLDQGPNFVGISGMLTSGNYTLVFGGGYSDGCNVQTQSKYTPDGLPAYQRPAELRAPGQGPEGTAIVFRGGYHLFNEQNPIPEPGTLALLATGATGLMAMTLRRRRRARQTQRD